MSNPQATRTKLRKAVRAYRRMQDSVPYPAVNRSPEGRQTADTLRSLYQEFGRSAVRAEIDRQRSPTEVGLTSSTNKSTLVSSPASDLRRTT